MIHEYFRLDVAVQSRQVKKTISQKNRIKKAEKCIISQLFVIATIPGHFMASKISNLIVTKLVHLITFKRDVKQRHFGLMCK